MGGDSDYGSEKPNSQLVIDKLLSLKLKVRFGERWRDYTTMTLISKMARDLLSIMPVPKYYS